MIIMICSMNIYIVHNHVKQKNIHISKFKQILLENNIKSVHTRTGSVYHFLKFKKRPSELKI